MEIKKELMKIIEECKSKGYDDLQFETDRQYIVNAIMQSGLIKEE